MKKLTKLVLIAILLCTASINLKAQFEGGNLTMDLTIVDAHRENYSIEKYESVTGDPYFLKDWAKGTVKSAHSTLKDQLLKYDEVENKVLVKGDDGTPRSFSVPVREFTLDDRGKERRFIAGFPNGTNNDAFTFFEVLADGNVKFLRKNIKVISQNKEYSGKITKNVTSETKYYLSIQNAAPVVVKLEEKSILALMPNKTNELSTYAKNNKLGFKKAEDIAKLVEYYNTL